MKATEGPAPTAQAAAWRIKLLGRLEVTAADGMVARFSSRTALSLLAYLSLLKYREHANDALYELFWPDSDGDKQAQNLRRAIADLRKVLERDLPLGSVIVTRKGHVSLNPDRVATDVERFLDQTQHSEPDQTRLAEAVGLYAGPLLSPLSNDWVMGHRMELEERFGQTVDRLCGLLIEQGSVKEAINFGRAAVVAAPSREDVHIALIQAYRHSGMGVEALRQFEELERILDETWGETPSARAREALEAAFAESQPRKHNLPEQLTSFIGREREIEEVCELLSKTRLLTLTGSGGCGKTRLTLQVASSVLDQYRDGVWFVEFAALADPGLVPNAVAAALGLSEQPSKSFVQTLLDHLKAKQLLLVLDNCEHLLLACAELAEAVLRQCPSIVVLANSREGLAIGGELVYHVPSLSLPNPKGPQTPESLSHFESVQLFAERAGQVHRGFAITDQNAPALASVCQRLDGIPLAIELAAARLRSLSVEEINARLDQRFRLLTGGSRTALPRHQTLRSLIDWSYDLLNDAEKVLLRRLAVFAGGWTLKAVEEVCTDYLVHRDESLDLMTNLCAKSLVISAREGCLTRYRILETIREYAYDRLLKSGDEARWRNRHLTYFLALAEGAEPHLTGPEQEDSLKLLASEHDNLRNALAWSVSNAGNAEASLRLVGALYRFWGLHGDLREGRTWVTAALEQESLQRHPASRGRATLAAAGLAWRGFDLRDAKGYASEALVLLREVDDQTGIHRSLHILGMVALAQSRFSESKMLHEQALDSRRRLGDQEAISSSLVALGIIQFYQGNLKVARALFEESLAICTRIGDAFGMSAPLHYLGCLALEEGNFPSAEALLNESIAISKKLGRRASGSFSLNRLGLVRLAMGDVQRARALQQECLRAFRESDGSLDCAVQGLEGLAQVESARADHLRAANLWGAADRIRKDSANVRPPSWQPRFEQYVTAAREAMGDDEAFDRAWQEGRELTLEQAIELALAQDRLET